MAIKKTPKKNSQVAENTGEVVKKKRGRPRKELPDPSEKIKKIKEQQKQALIEARKVEKIAKNSDIHGNSIYSHDFPEKARNFCLLTNGTDEQLADFLGVTAKSVREWKIRHPLFGAAITEGKIGADMAVAGSLLSRAKGYTPPPEIKKELTIDAEGNETTKVTETIKEIPPDVTAQKHWLSLRQPKIWRTPNISGIMERFQSGELSAQDAAIEIESMGVALPDVLKMTLAKEMGLEAAAEYKPIPIDALEAAYLKGMAELEARTASLAGRGLVIEQEVNDAKNGK